MKMTTTPSQRSLDLVDLQSRCDGDWNKMALVLDAEFAKAEAHYAQDEHNAYQAGLSRLYGVRTVTTPMPLPESLAFVRYNRITAVDDTGDYVTPECVAELLDAFISSHPRIKAAEAMADILENRSAMTRDEREYALLVACRAFRALSPVGEEK